MNTKKCTKCQIEKPLSEFATAKSRNSVYAVSQCYTCSRIRLRERAKRIKSSLLRADFLNCVIRENNKEYYTNNLSSTDILELKELGYYFIFK